MLRPRSGFANGLAHCHDVSGHCPRSADILSALNAGQPRWSTYEHWTPKADNMSTLRSLGCVGEGSVRIRHGNVPVRWQNRFEARAWGAALLPGNSPHGPEGGVTARKNLLGNGGVLELVYQNWPATSELVLSETQLARLVAPQMEKPKGALPATRKANFPPGSRTGESRRNCGMLTLTAHVTV